MVPLLLMRQTDEEEIKMGRVERKIKRVEYEALERSFSRAKDAVQNLWYSTQILRSQEWLGGDHRTTNNYLEASEELKEIGRKVSELRKLLWEADHELAMQRAMNED